MGLPVAELDEQQKEKHVADQFVQQPAKARGSGAAGQKVRISLVAVIYVTDLLVVFRNNCAAS